ncbi:MAG TPA: ABC transporter permease [Candidatus Bathyarchaeia archaeon]|nr:ABC transporter permease [Candidatus Bathyarchaeia archaeon]
MIEDLVSNIRVAYARLWVRVKGGNREPHWIFTEVTVPVLTLSAYVYLYKMLSAPAEFAGFVVIGGTMMAFWSNVLWNMSAQFYWEKETGTLQMYLVAPISRMAILLGMALGGIVNTALRAAAILAVGIYVFQVPIFLRDPVVALLIFVLTIVALYALGMLFASLFLMYGREAWHTASLLQEPVHFLSGFYFPVRYLPFLIQLVASAIPITFGLDGIRRVIISGETAADVLPHVAALVVFIAFLMPLAKLALGYMENLGKKEGRLTLRWQ